MRAKVKYIAHYLAKLCSLIYAFIMVDESHEFVSTPPSIAEKASKLITKAAKKFDEQRGSAIQRLRSRATEKPPIVSGRLKTSIEKFATGMPKKG